jgi:hypothetical protein
VEDLDRLKALEDRLQALADRKAIEDCVCRYKCEAEADLLRRVLAGEEPSTYSRAGMQMDLQDGRVLRELTDFESTVVSACKIEGSTATAESLRIGIYASLSDAQRHVIGLKLKDVLELHSQNWRVISRHIQLQANIVGADAPAQTSIQPMLN